MRTSGLTLQINLPRIVANVRAIRQRCGVEVWAVVKANAYGLGIERVSRAIASEVDGFCVFRLDEAVAVNLGGQTGKPIIALGPPEPDRLNEYLAQRVRPAVSNSADAESLRAAGPILCVDTGMQRFAASPDQIDAILQAGNITEAFTHAATVEHVERFRQLTDGRGLKRHAAATALLDEPQARLDTVRPGLAMYEGAVRVVAPLVDVRESHGPVGYTGFTARRHGVILAGYSHGLRPGPCLVNGITTHLPEVGMQTAYVDLTNVAAQTGDEVVLLGDTLAPSTIAQSWRCSPQEVLINLVRHLSYD